MPYYSAWQEAIDREGLVEGALIKFTNEKWTKNDLAIPIGADGVQLCMLMVTAMHGAVLYRDHVPVDYQISRYEDCPPSNGKLADDWQPYTACQVVGMDENHRGQLMAFVSTALGGRLAFKRLIPGYGRKGEKEFPIVVLGSKRRKGEKRDYVDPTFEIVGWAPRDDFKDYLPPPRPPREAPAPLLAPPMHDEPESVLEALEPGAEPVDDLPF